MLPHESYHTGNVEPKKPIEVLALELERLKGVVPESKQTALPTWLINEFFSDGADGTCRGFSIFHEAVAYLGYDARAMDLRDARVAKSLVTQVAKLQKALGKTLQLMDGPCQSFVDMGKTYYMHQSRLKGNDMLAAAQEFTAMQENMVGFHAFADEWVRRKQRVRGRRNMAPLNGLVTYLFQAYQSIDSKADLAAYPVGSKQDVALKGRAAEFVEGCIDMVNAWAKHIGHTQAYSHRNIASAIQAYQKQQRIVSKTL